MCTVYSYIMQLYNVFVVYINLWCMVHVQRVSLHGNFIHAQFKAIYIYAVKNMWSVCTLARSSDADTVSKDIISEQVLNDNCPEGPTATLSHDANSVPNSASFAKSFSIPNSIMNCLAGFSPIYSHYKNFCSEYLYCMLLGSPNLLLCKLSG